jgi:hypothetical protein
LIGSGRIPERGRACLTALLVSLAAIAAAGCTSLVGPTPDGRDLRPGRSLAPTAFFDYKPLNPADVHIQPEGLTVEQSWLLDLYTLFHARDYKAFRLVMPDEEGQDRIGHLLLPAGNGPFPAVVAFEILDGPHDVSEALAKALVRRGYAVARLERRPLDLAHQNNAMVVRDRMREGVIDARRMLDWLVTHPKIDATRIAAAGVSVGSLQALLLTACDPRIRGGFYVLTGGDLPKMFFDSTERPVRQFRDRMMAANGWTTRQQFIAGVRPLTEAVDPLTYAPYLDPTKLMIASGRFDHVIPSSRAQELFEALGRPRWYKLPCGHYSVFPFFWWAMARGADHLDELMRN